MAGRENPYKNVNLSKLNNINNMENMKNIFPPSQAVKNVRAGLPYMGVSPNANAEVQRQARDEQFLQDLKNLRPPREMSYRETLNALRSLPRPPQLTLDQKVIIFFNQLCAFLRTRNMSRITTIKKFKETINRILIGASVQKEEKSEDGITKIDKETFDRIKPIINSRDPTALVPCLLEVLMPKPPTGPAAGAGIGGRKKKRKRKTTKRKTTKHKSKARMTKQKRKVNGVTRNVRISTTGRKYVLLKGRRHFL